MDIKSKKNYITQNNYQCRFGTYKNLVSFPPKKFYYDPHFNLDDDSITNICDVYIKHLHPLLLIKELRDKGLNPAVVSSVTNKYDAENLDTYEGFLDEYLLLRTNYCKTIMPHIYPLHGPEVLYNHNLSIVRNETLNFITESNLISNFNQMIISPIENPKLHKNKLKMSEYFLTKELVENIFQTAILSKNDVLILNDLSCKHTKIPLEDIAYIYNNTILKYGHFFKLIIIAIPLYDPADRAIYSFFDKYIIKPQSLVTISDLDLDNLENIEE
jgi:hypothetical protein